MARPKKSEEKAKDQATLQVSIEDFVRTRDSVSHVQFSLLCRDSKSTLALHHSLRRDVNTHHLISNLPTSMHNTNFMS